MVKRTAAALIARLLPLGASVLLLGVTAGADQAPFEVASVNVYLGADLAQITEADPADLETAVAAWHAIALQSDYAARAAVIARKLQEAPLLQAIGLQEVLLLRRQSPGDVLSGNPQPATTVEVDYLEVLMAELAATGLSFVIAAVNENVDLELPLPVAGQIDDIRITDRNVVLVRSDLDWFNPQSANYLNADWFPFLGELTRIDRGYAAVDFLPAGHFTPVRFVSTQFDPQSVVARSNQAYDLNRSIPPDATRLLLSGSLNSDPMLDLDSVHPTLEGNNFVDLWTEANGIGGGPTCCQTVTLDNDLSGLNERFDFVMVRSGAVPPVTNVEVHTFLDDTADQTAGALWPSRRAAVLARMNFAVVPDSDFDGVTDASDNCIFVYNPPQRDSDADGYGNFCDADFNNNCLIEFADLQYMRQNFFTSDPDADLNGDGAISFSDLAIMKSIFFAAPGPSGSTDACSVSESR